MGGPAVPAPAEFTRSPFVSSERLLDPFQEPELFEIGLEEFKGADAIWGATGRDHRGHIWFGVASRGPTAHLFEYTPETGLLVDRGDVMGQMEQLGLIRPGERQAKIHSKIVQVDPEHIYFASMDEAGERSDGSALPTWGGHLWRLRLADYRWEHLLAAPEALIAVAGGGRWVYSLGYFNHVLYQFDSQTGQTRQTTVGSVGGHISRNFLVDSRGHVYAPRVQAAPSTDTTGAENTAPLPCSLVEFDTQLNVVGETSLAEYGADRTENSHGIIAHTRLTDESMVFATHRGQLYQIRPPFQADSPAVVEALGWFHPAGVCYTPSLFCLDGERQLWGIGQRRGLPFDRILFDLPSRQSRAAPLDDLRGRGANLLLYGSETRDNQGAGYLVGQAGYVPRIYRVAWTPDLPPRSTTSAPDDDRDRIEVLQADAVRDKTAPWGYWGLNPDRYSTWSDHSNRLIPVYCLGGSLDAFQDERSPYRDPQKLQQLYGRLPPGSLNPDAEYFDQTDIHRLQVAAAEAGKRYLFLIVFDGMDWQTTAAAAAYQSGWPVEEGTPQGLAFLDLRPPGVTRDVGYCVTSPYCAESQTSSEAQLVVALSERRGGYDARLGGDFPWSWAPDPSYPLGRNRARPDVYTDSAAAATSLCSGIKTFNGAINVAPDGSQVEPIARRLQERGFAIGVVTSVPLSHATPAAAYANNVSRDAYHDLAEDLLGLRSRAHREAPLPGVDVLLGAGWSPELAEQGANLHIALDALQRSDIERGGRYVVATRTPDRRGDRVLHAAARRAAAGGHRLVGLFGAGGGHLPYRSANGDYHPGPAANGTVEEYSPADLRENPTLADMTQAALQVLEARDQPFWMMIEAGDVDFANHQNNLDAAIGAVISGDDAFRVVAEWVDQHQAWDESLIVVTSDHGHYLHLVDPAALAGEQPETSP